MKTILFSLLLMFAGVYAYAQKSYVTVYCTQDNSNAIVLSGDIPQSMKNYYLPYEFEGKQTVFVIDDIDHVTMLLASEY